MFTPGKIIYVRSSYEMQVHYFTDVKISSSYYESRSNSEQLGVYRVSYCIQWISRAAPCEKSFQAYAESEGPDQPAHARRLIRVFTFC